MKKHKVFNILAVSECVGSSLQLADLGHFLNLCLLFMLLSETTFSILKSLPSLKIAVFGQECPFLYCLYSHNNVEELELFCGCFNTISSDICDGLTFYFPCLPDASLHQL